MLIFSKDSIPTDSARLQELHRVFHSSFQWKVGVKLEEIEDSRQKIESKKTSKVEAARSVIFSNTVPEAYKAVVSSFENASCEV